MINIQFGVTKENLALLHNILEEASGYGIWSVFYGEEEINSLSSIRNMVAKLFEESQKVNKESFLLELSFKEGQVLKKVIVFYLTNNFKDLKRSQFETISDFILFVDDSLAFEIEQI